MVAALALEVMFENVLEFEPSTGTNTWQLSCIKFD